MVNNAGVVQGKSFMDSNENFISKTMVINAESHFWLIKDVIGPMMRKNSGHIVSIASIAGIAGTAGMTDYCASKFAAYGLNEALRVEMKLLKKNINFTTICPFYFNSGMFEGAKCSLIFPLLDARYVARRTMNAILQNEGEVTIPWLMGVLAHLGKGILPSPAQDFLAYIVLGYESIIGNYKGHQGQKNPLTYIANKE